jgi:hypothetical protein
MSMEKKNVARKMNLATDIENRPSESVRIGAFGAEDRKAKGRVDW